MKHAGDFRLATTATEFGPSTCRTGDAPGPGRTPFGTPQFRRKFREARSAQGFRWNPPFRYVTDAIPHAISASLPIRAEPFGDVAARGFFSNLLFENEMRDQVMQRHGIVGSLMESPRDSLR
ncbi:MAG: HipA N-terminal domain-containing protein [Boseongicola sp.]|nr:HipA N-terminal domain-containing protein [Boseongicola sp.]MDE0344688.1 HipA N-terminal domain-containing protein [Boseongicola sp.]